LSAITRRSRSPFKAKSKLKRWTRRAPYGVFSARLAYFLEREDWRAWRVPLPPGVHPESAANALRNRIRYHRIRNVKVVRRGDEVWLIRVGKTSPRERGE